MAGSPSSGALKTEDTEAGGGEPPTHRTETLPATDTSTVVAAAGCRSFTQLFAGAMASPAGSCCAIPILAMPVDAAGVPMVAVPCFIAPANLLESSGFTGQFSMTHQAVLAMVTAHSQIQLPAASSVINTSSQPLLSSLTPLPLQERSPPVAEDSICTPEAERQPSSEQKPQSADVVVKATPADGYNWRKYGQKQVKSNDNFRSYYKCTHADCLAKKKVERRQDGHVTETIYKGCHNHDRPPKTRYAKERGPRSGKSSVKNENLDTPSREITKFDPSIFKSEDCSSKESHEQELPELKLRCSSDCEGDAGIKIEEDLGDEPVLKRRLGERVLPSSAPKLKKVREPETIVQTSSDIGIVSDGYRWRKYGQKIVKGSSNPRSYYRCTHIGCSVRKHVERASDDAKPTIITYDGNHNHDLPSPKNSK